MASEDERAGARERREERRERPRGRGEHERQHVSLEGDREVHLAIIARQWLGSAPPTAQAYARALAQWRQLPGVVTTTATDLGNAADVPVPADGDGENTQP